MTSKDRIAEELLSIGAVFFRPDEPFIWASGIKSPVYCDNRLTLTAPVVRTDIENSLAETVKTFYPGCQALMGTSTAGIAHAAIAGHILDLPMTNLVWTWMLGYPQVFLRDRAPETIFATCQALGVQYATAVPLLINNICAGLKKRLAAETPEKQAAFRMAASAQSQYDAGKKLAPLRDEGALIFASGNVVHNLRMVPAATLIKPSFISMLSPLQKIKGRCKRTYNTLAVFMLRSISRFPGQVKAKTADSAGRLTRRRMCAILKKKEEARR